MLFCLLPLLGLPLQPKGFNCVWCRFLSREDDLRQEVARWKVSFRCSSCSLPPLLSVFGVVFCQCPGGGVAPRGGAGPSEEATPRSRVRGSRVALSLVRGAATSAGRPNATFLVEGVAQKWLLMRVSRTSGCVFRIIVVFGSRSL